MPPIHFHQFSTIDSSSFLRKIVAAPGEEQTPIELMKVKEWSELSEMDCLLGGKPITIHRAIKN